MRTMMLCALLVVIFCFGAPAMAESARQSAKSDNATVRQAEKAPDDNEIGEDVPDAGDSGTDKGEIPLDNKEGYNTSERRSADGPATYDPNTGMMNVVPSDSEGDIEE